VCVREDRTSRTVAATTIKELGFLLLTLTDTRLYNVVEKVRHVS